MRPNAVSAVGFICRLYVALGAIGYGIYLSLKALGYL